MIIYAATASGGLAALKYGSRDHALAAFVDGRLSLNLNLPNVSGIFLYGLSFLIYTFLIAKFELGYIIPISTALVYIFIFLFAAFFFGESFTLIKALGIGLILAGVFVLNVYKG